jgi:hypothetical protein
VKTKGILVSLFKENKILIVHHSNVIHVTTKVYVSYNKSNFKSAEIQSIKHCTST